jgi:predicted outer membrane repeat protein
MRSLVNKSSISCAVLIVLISRAFAAGKVIYVDDDGTAGFNNIQAAIDDANSGDTIIVADGRYAGDGNWDIDFKGRAITLRSENGPENCLIDCNATESEPHRGFYFHSGEDANSIVSGLTITGGYAPEEEYVYLEYPVKRSCGGGIYCTGSSPTIINCKIKGNSAKVDGGGVYLQGAGAPRLIGCTISENRAGNIGGGMAAAYCSGWTHNCVISNNSAGSAGGGVGFWYAGAPMLSYCRISENSANGSGGGIISRSSGVSITNCVVTKNTAAGGGGICTAGDGFLTGQFTITNCTFSRNTATSKGGAIFCGEFGFPSVSNCILWGDKGEQGQEIAMLCAEWGSELSIRYSDVQGGQAGVTRGPYEPCRLNWGPGNIEVDPLFREPNNADYHLKSRGGTWDQNTKTWVQDDLTSPCIDAGDPNSPIGSEPFPNGGRANMGAYGGTTEASKSYFGGSVCETIIAGDINGDCRVDFADLAFMASHWLECVGPECEPVVEIGVLVNSPVYLSGEYVSIWIAAHNGSPDPVTLVFPDGLQVSYQL